MKKRSAYYSHRKRPCEIFRHEDSVPHFGYVLPVVMKTGKTEVFFFRQSRFEEGCHHCVRCVQSGLRKHSNLFSFSGMSWRFKTDVSDHVIIGFVKGKKCAFHPVKKGRFLNGFSLFLMMEHRL